MVVALAAVFPVHYGHFGRLAPPPGLALSVPPSPRASLQLAWGPAFPPLWLGVLLLLCFPLQPFAVCGHVMHCFR
jgi:hypothetical protein